MSNSIKGQIKSYYVGIAKKVNSETKVSCGCGTSCCGDITNDALLYNKEYYEETLVLLRTLRSEYGHLKAFYAENLDTEARITPEEVRRVYNKILSEAHKEGDYTYINPIISN